jgi:methyltransferase
MVIPFVALAVVVAFMLGELALSNRNERTLFARGATTPPDPVYRTMQWAYPGAFIAMAVEGAAAGTPSANVLLGGVVVVAAAKAVKFWAIATLGHRWTYRVLIVPGAPLVATGPYRWIRHPNYVGVVGELVGMALVTGARFSGPLAILFFSWLLRRRIAAEERALGIGIY